MACSSGRNRARASRFTSTAPRTCSCRPSTTRPCRRTG